MRVIARLIELGLMVPGTKLPPERELAARLGVSRTGLREALAVFQALGIVRRQHGVGITVNEEPSFAQFLNVTGLTLLLAPRGKMLRDLHEVRSMIERECVRRAAIEATDDELGALTLQVIELGKARDRRTYADLHIQFHIAIARAARNQVLVALLELIRGLLLEEMLQVVDDPVRLQRSALEHLRLVQVLTLRDADAAVAVVNEHLARYRRDAEAHADGGVGALATTGALPPL